jgi:hypothetical protein
MLGVPDRSLGHPPSWAQNVPYGVDLRSLQATDPRARASDREADAETPRRPLIAPNCRQIVAARPPALDVREILRLAASMSLRAIADSGAVPT